MLIKRNILICVIIALNICGNETLIVDNGRQMIVDYFSIYKSASYVVGFLCWPETDIKFIYKALSIVGIPFSAPPSPSNILISLKSTPSGRLGVLLDSSCPFSNTVLMKASKLALFNESYHWLIIGSNNSDAKSIFGHLSIYINAEITLAEINDDGWSLSDIYSHNLNRNQHLQVLPLGYWDDEDGLVIPPQKLKYRQRKNFMGMKMIIGTVANGGYTNSNMKEALQSFGKTKGISQFSKYFNELIFYCQEEYNFTIEFKISSAWAGRTPNGSRLGVLGYVQRKEVDLASAGVYIKDKRGEEMDTIYGGWMFESALMFRYTGSGVGSFLTPFADSVWRASLLLLLFIIVVLKVSTTLEKRVKKNLENSWVVTILGTLSAFCQQGMDPIPSFLSSRLTCFMTLVFSLLFYNYYTSSVVGALLSNVPIGPQTIRELLHSPYVIVFEDIGYGRVLLAEGKLQPGLHDLYVKKILPPRPHGPPAFTDNENGVELMKKGGVAYHTEPQSAYPIISRIFLPEEICQLRQIYLYEKRPLALVFPKRSPYTKIFSIGVHKAQENGISDALLRKLRVEKPLCTSGATVSPVSTIEVAPALYLMIIGSAVAFFVLFLEISYNKWSRNNNFKIKFK